jgi:uncharacterized membrane protein YdjX (TVP38/TMEM64 family)
LLVCGAVFGAFYGTVYNVFGLVVGGMLGYQVANLLGRKFVVRVAGKRLKRVESILERRGFWPLVQTRFMPIPFPVINYGAALAGVRPPLFLSATLVGLIPSTLVHTYFISELFTTHGSERAMMLVWYAAAFVLFNVMISILWLREHAWWRRYISRGFAWTVRSIFYAIDRFLRRQQRTFEFWDDPQCLFRVSVTHTSGPICVSDGEVPAGAKVLELHAWNEHILHLPPDGSQIAVVRKMYRMVVSSLRVLAGLMEKDPRLAGVQAVGGFMPFFFSTEDSSAERLFSRMGFAMNVHRKSGGPIRMFGENLHAWMMRWTFNPATLRNRRLSMLRWVDVWMSTDDLVRLYASKRTMK